LDGGVTVTNELHGLIFPTETLRHTTTIGIEASPLSEIVQSHSDDGLMEGRGEEKEEQGRTNR
jgi:hypothetical protein